MSGWNTNLPQELSGEKYVIFMLDWVQLSCVVSGKQLPICHSYILLTKHEDRIGRISARGLDSTNRAQRVPYRKDQVPIFSQDGPEQAWLIRDLLRDWNCLEETPKWSIDCKDTTDFKRAIFI